MRNEQHSQTDPALPYVGNNPVNSIDPFGLWSKPVRNKSEAWATICAGDGDTWKSLSELLKLNPNEAKKWVQNYDDKPESGKKYAIPNTVVTFTSKSTKWVSDGVLSFANEVRRIIKSDAKKYEKDGFHVIRHFQSDDSGEFVDEWGADGIYMYLFAGHGAYKDGKYYGFIIGDGQVTPDMIKSLKYKLARVKALTCGSALVQYNATAFDSNGNLVQSYWKSLVSSNGSFSGFDDWVNWVNGIDHFVTSPGSP